MVQSRWFCVHSHPNSEARAAGHLRRQGYDVYVPHYLRRRRHAGRNEIVGRALFPRYLFCRIDLNVDRWRSIDSTLGVSRLVCIGDVPAAVPPGIVEALQAREVDGFIQLDREPLRAGDRVRVTGGEFETFFGRLDESSERDRVAVLLDLLGRKVRVELDANLVAAA
jgi:transcriptional antiterminator RfaH